MHTLLAMNHSAIKYQLEISNLIIFNMIPKIRVPLLKALRHIN